MEDSKEISFKEKRIRELTLIYYSRSDVKKAIFKFSQNRETIPRYYEGFGKRPDILQFENDLFEQVKKGATSFHCSEEIWEDPQELSLDLSKKEMNNLRIGWDLLLDIDSPYLEYSKIYANLLVETLEFHNLNNFAVKFSGSKGFHIIIPWKAFPEQIYNQETKEMFPEWPKIICQYLSEIIKPRLSEKIFQDQSLKELAQRTGKQEEDLIVDECLSCKRRASKKYKITWICTNCKSLGDLTKVETNKRIPRCPECEKPLYEKNREELLYCEYCNFQSDKNPEMFKKSKEKTEVLIDADLILVAPRHLFRMPYSLHEKTALASIVIDKHKIKDFQINDANPFKVEIKDYYPEPKKNEAKNLLLQALDWYEQEKQKETLIDEKRHSQEPQIKKSLNKEFNKVVIENPAENIMPPQIILLLKGIKHDGRKRALFILLGFFKSLGMKDNELEKRIFEWNDRNAMPLKKGYILSQLNWYKRNPTRLPPNFNNHIYKDLGVDYPDNLSRQLKNPVSYAIKKYFASKNS